MYMYHDSRLIETFSLTSFQNKIKQLWFIMIVLLFEQVSLLEQSFDRRGLNKWGWVCDFGEK